ncbi:unnamed protein product [Caenorhabditis auriculariae]|uniref:FAD/NAD(P)-binding domain-containing protein n=1 Tax=Caenorhabditis auriculariae TaxID=2777116 RepID=A0A8S1HA74_9PELO|nr:unnamed protein product [Caenorhabditis auriculariae]
MRYVVVGGGIAGVSCALGLIREDRSPDSKVVLISASSHVKMVTNWHKVGQFTEQFDVQETEVSLTEDPRFELLNAVVSKWDSKKQELETTVGRIIKYDKLCIATGARPKCPWKNDRVLTIRDMDTALTLQEKLADAKNVVIVGNGGIATELVYELNNVNVTWLIRDSSISSSFFPAEAENFLLPRLKTGRTSGSKNSGILKRPEFSASPSKNQSKISGAALGPDWCTAIQLSSSEQNLGHNVDVVNNCEVFDVKFNEEVLISYEKRGKSFEVSCDVLIWATGVEPNSDLWKRDCKESGIIVDDVMKTNYPQRLRLWRRVLCEKSKRNFGNRCDCGHKPGKPATFAPTL